MTKKAFSLIEVSVVVLIIGILISGISTGIDLYQDFKLATARQLTQNSRVGRIDGLTLWLETTSEKSFEKPNPNDGDLIGIWKDINPKSFGFFLIQPNNANKPIYNRKFRDSVLPSLRFNDSQFIYKDNVVGNQLFDKNIITIFIVQYSLSSSMETSLSWTPLASPGVELSRLNLHIAHNSRTYFDMWKSGEGSGRLEILNDGKYNYINRNTIFRFVRNQNYMAMFTNGSEFGSMNSATSDVNINLVSQFTVGRLNSDPNYLLNGTISEIIIINRSLNSKEIMDIEEYLSKKYSIKINKS
jgi:prepilin-type N-terminal cleavage/methylation domain-containing protein